MKKVILLVAILVSAASILMAEKSIETAKKGKSCSKKEKSCCSKKAKTATATEEKKAEEVKIDAAKEIEKK
ncbi:MAG: hypothetical protein ACRC9X_00185 [Bacteroidales bacterium]